MCVRATRDGDSAIIHAVIFRASEAIYFKHFTKEVAVGRYCRTACTMIYIMFLSNLKRRIIARVRNLYSYANSIKCVNGWIFSQRLLTKVLNTIVSTYSVGRNYFFCDSNAIYSRAMSRTITTNEVVSRSGNDVGKNSKIKKILNTIINWQRGFNRFSFFFKRPRCIILCRRCRNFERIRNAHKKRRMKGRIACDVIDTDRRPKTRRERLEWLRINASGAIGNTGCAYLTTINSENYYYGE